MRRESSLAPQLFPRLGGNFSLTFSVLSIRRSERACCPSHAVVDAEREDGAEAFIPHARKKVRGGADSPEESRTTEDSLAVAPAGKPPRIVLGVRFRENGR
jgi:hypothetical protein